ncbi:hypothetical protein B0H14DRAFT_2274877, partial [Mycena olivaceomarginata]
EWEHFLYVGKVAFFGWGCIMEIICGFFFFHSSSCIMGHVAYFHHYTYYLPTLYVAVLMLAHLLDRFVFSSHRWRQQTKVISLGSIVSCFWWVR